MYYATHRIPDERIADLTAAVSKLNRKLFKGKIHGSPIEINVHDRHAVIREHLYTWVTIKGGVLSMNGWTFVSRYDFERSADGKTLVAFTNTVPGMEVPASYWDVKAPVCEHCNTARYRKHTFLVRGPNGEHKLVGSNCLADFFGFDPAQLIRGFEFFAAIGNLADEFSGFGLHHERHYSFERVLSLANAVVRVSGFRSRKAAGEGTPASADVVAQILNPPVFSGRDAEYQRAEYRKMVEKYAPTAADVAQVEPVLAWIDAQVDSSEYIHNLKLIRKLGSCGEKRLGLLVSAAGVYLREIGQKAERATKTNEHFGKIGDRIERQVSCVAINGYMTDWGPAAVVKMEDAEGRAFTWFAKGSINFKVGESFTVRGTIKKHDDFKGQKQTVLTRCHAVQEVPA